jgi:hypothetical protein
LLPVPTEVPPHDPLYQLKVVPEPPEYDNVVDCLAQIIVDVAETPVGAVGKGLIVIVIVLEVAGLPDVHVKEEVRTQ